MGLKQTVAPTREPLDRDEVKDHLRITSSDEDAYVDRLIVAARQAVEETTKRQLITATWKQTFEQFPVWEMRLDRPELIAVSSITYVASDGTTTTHGSSEYTTSTLDHVGVITPAWGKSWPTARCQLDSVTVTYTAGYGATPATIPQAIRLAMLLLIGHWHENREAVAVGTITKAVEFSYESLLAPYTVGTYR